MENTRCFVYILNVLNIIGDYFSDSEKFVIIKNSITVLAFIVSGASFMYTLYRNGKTDREQKKLKEDSEQKYVQQKNLEEEREKLRNELYEEMTRASVIPYFNLSLKDEDIEEKDDEIFLKVKLINIGKESATNIRLNESKLNQGSGEFIISATGRDYYIREYLSQYYALRGDEVTFILVTKITEDQKEGYRKVVDSITFSVTYFDCIRNGYKQEFRFEYGLGRISHKNDSFRPEKLPDTSKDL